MKKLLHQLQILYNIEIYHYDFKVSNLCTDAFGNAGLPDYRDARFCEKGTIYKGDIGKLNNTDKFLSPRK
ncbi:hypothetical protein DASC09_055420 [Saccharomycopsis crataegensis]|uniref:Protein kinase domain-containing protein n=1 Tax=Saccharomycopsis crataegensis TaxID=43959 RepID=A0AAV5QVR2_9ASCO|nr:hypothetical protein DASC09_055420 [Saccharomycopsis crataegensis]